MKLTAAKFALFVFVLLALGMLVAAAPQGIDETDDTETPSPTGSTDDAPTTPGTGKTRGGGGTSSGGSKTGTDPDTGDDSTTKTPAKSGGDDDTSDPPSRPSGGSESTPDDPVSGDDTSRDDDATPKTSQSGGSAKDNDDDNGDNDDRTNNNSNGNTRNGKENRDSNNNDSADSNDDAKGAKNADTTDDAKQNEPTDSTDPNDPVAQETVTESEESTPEDLKLPANATCTSNDVCESGLCENGKCAPEKEDDDKIGKTLGMALGIIVAVMCIGMVLLTGVRMMLKRRRSDYYSKRISEIAAPSRATTPSFLNDSSSLVLEKQARNGNYAFNSPEAAISSDSVRPPAQGYYGAADGYDMEQSYTRTGMPNYANDQHLYAPNAPANDWAVTPTYGAFPTTAAPDPNPISVPQPTMLPVPPMSPIPPRNVQPAADPRSNGSNAFGNLHSGGAGERESELIMYGGSSSQNLTRESMYDASDDQQNDGGRYKMNSIYSAYGRDSLYADTKDTPSVPDVPDLPSQYQKRDNY